ncbi:MULTISPECIES: hypothetical protein [unclassified Variovorax]|jgi:hypothetical protein|uniref:hypothetical protein n=1 Tax=unclassified Variovorax TaxID=663243 RepID=UPI001785DDFD|nr:hypothetical protein [Variovorax sp. VRV01]MBD9663220.1 hypothetical protein [Variovorax sp. VRV01]
MNEGNPGRAGHLQSDKVRSLIVQFVADEMLEPVAKDAMPTGRRGGLLVDELEQGPSRPACARPRTWPRPFFAVYVLQGRERMKQRQHRRSHARQTAVARDVIEVACHVDDTARPGEDSECLFLVQAVPLVRIPANVTDDSALS